MPKNVRCRIIGAIIGFVLIPAILNSIISFYYNFLDTKTYWSWENLKLNKAAYNPCDTIIISGTRQSLINVQATAITEIALVRTLDEQFLSAEKNVYVYPKAELYIRQGPPADNVAAYVLPCEKTKIEDGLYSLRGIVTFRVQDVEKNYTWQTSNFVVKAGEPLGSIEKI